MSGGQRRLLYFCDCELFVPARGIAGRFIRPLSVPLQGTCSATDKHFPLTGSELTTSLPRVVFVAMLHEQFHVRRGLTPWFSR